MTNTFRVARARDGMRLRRLQNMKMTAGQVSHVAEVGSVENQESKVAAADLAVVGAAVVAVEAATPEVEPPTQQQQEEVEDPSALERRPSP